MSFVEVNEKWTKRKTNKKSFCRSFEVGVLFERGLLEFFKCIHIGH